MDLQLRERVYIVTGGTQGLGRAVADALVAEGARVVVSSRTRANVEGAAEELGDAAVGVVAGNADPGTPARLLAAARELGGRVDGALISVGGPPAGPLLEATDAQWRDAFESVFLGAVRLGREIGTALGEGGSLAFVLSTSVRAPLANLGISNGLRPGLAMVAKNLAEEFAPRGVRVNGLLPGRFATDRVAELDASSGDPEGARRRAVAGIPLGRYGQPEEFGRIGAFVLSPAASYLTGVMLAVDGGLLRGL